LSAKETLQIRGAACAHLEINIPSPITIGFNNKKTVVNETYDTEELSHVFINVSQKVLSIPFLQGRHGTDSGFHDLAPVVEYDSLKRCQREVGEGLQGGRGLPQLKKEWIAPSD
jgi:hypothetical protein